MISVGHVSNVLDTYSGVQCTKTRDFFSSILWNVMLELNSLHVAQHTTENVLHLFIPNFDDHRYNCRTVPPLFVCRNCKMLYFTLYHNAGTANVLYLITSHLAEHLIHSTCLTCR